MNRCRCLRCGKLKRGKKTRYICQCGYPMIPVSGNLLSLAKQLTELGFELSRAEDFITAFDQTGPIEIGMLNLEFSKVYDKKVFYTVPHALQDDYVHNVYTPQDDAPFCRITHYDENYLALGRDVTSRKAMEMTIRGLTMWATELESSGAADIYRLGEWI